MPNPWDYAAKTRNEFAEQVALFMWSTMATNYGLQIANDPDSYNVRGHAQRRSIELEGEAYALPQLKWLHAIKNQGHGDAVRGAQSKAEGVKAGVPDMMLPVPTLVIGGIPGEYRREGHCGLYIELKRLKSDRGAKGSSSEVQREWHDYLRSVGYKVEVAYGWIEAAQIILTYLGVGNALQPR